MEVTKKRPRLLQTMNSRSFYFFLLQSYKNRLLQCLQTLNKLHKDNTMIYYEGSFRRKTGLLHSLCVRPRDLLYLSLKACKLISPTMNIMNYKLSFIYRLPRLLLIVQGLRPAVKGYRLWYELPPAPAFRRHKETSFQRGSEGGVPIMFLIQSRGREINERSI